MVISKKCRAYTHVLGVKERKMSGRPWVHCRAYTHVLGGSERRKMIGRSRVHTLEIIFYRGYPRISYGPNRGDKQSSIFQHLQRKKRADFDDTGSFRLWGIQWCRLKIMYDHAGMPKIKIRGHREIWVSNRAQIGARSWYYNNNVLGFILFIHTSTI